MAIRIVGLRVSLVLSLLGWWREGGGGYLFNGEEESEVHLKKIKQFLFRAFMRLNFHGMHLC